MAAAPAIAPARKLLITVVLRWEGAPSEGSPSRSPLSKRGAGGQDGPRGLPGRERGGEAVEREQADAAGGAQAGAVLGHVVAPVGQEQATAGEVGPLGSRVQRL